jgi:hypothetical protein
MGTEMAGGLLAAPFKAFAARDATKAVNAANRKAAEQQEAINKWRMQQWMEQFGEGGAPVFLPRYARDEEQQMFREGMDIFDATYRDPQEQRAAYERIQSMYMPFMEQQVGDIMTGKTTEDRLGYLAPVTEARLTQADVAEQAMQQAIEKRLQDLAVQQRAAGFGGAGTAAQRQMLQAQFGATQQSAAERAAAGAQNAMDTRAVQEGELERRISTAAQAPQLVQAAAGIESLPTQAMTQDYLSRLQMFQPYHVQRGQAPPQLTAHDYQPEISGKTAMLSSIGGALQNLGGMSGGGGGGLLGGLFGG